MFTSITNELKQLVTNWEIKLLALDKATISGVKNIQGRTIKQIVGHMVDSATNNIHRTIYLQYRESIVDFPNYATDGNNDRWIEIQNYKDEDWNTLVQTWKYTHLHFFHVIENINPKKLTNQWVAAQGLMVSLNEMIEDFPRHFKLHIADIEHLLNQQLKQR